MALTDHIGKTIAKLPEKLDDFDTGLVIEFTDGTELQIGTCSCCGLWEVNSEDSSN